MASTIESGSGKDIIVVDEADLGKIDVVELPNAEVTEIAVNSAIKGLELGLSGEKDVEIAGARLKDTKISNEAPKGETVNVTLAVTKAANLEFSTTGKAATELSVAEGKFLNQPTTQPSTFSSGGADNERARGARSLPSTSRATRKNGGEGAASAEHAHRDGHRRHDHHLRDHDEPERVHDQRSRLRLRPPRRIVLLVR